ncbi:cysteine synthase A [Aliiroseovarius halocynthiae]|uniref:2,3-diaminopropionate biosynthesis protein SbnA n=1 Tax=Aliiroseovarius halocynthiae TaxID=985055 RepID=UPI00163DB673|nr:2,3-diaminopropionate biosynthesis protein SbnA [Aliiroseovarius halocynthiae]SMR71958.1 cysteine synthase A [Aliiroseovarius halocynthiae]
MNIHTYPSSKDAYSDWNDLINDDAYWRIDLVDDVTTYVKFEGLNPAGSIKLKPALRMLQGLEETGALQPGGKVIESSSGNLGIALAMVCARLGYHFTCVVDPNTPKDSINLIKALGANIVLIEQPDANGGYLESRINYIKQQIHLDPSLAWTNQYASPDNPAAHEHQTARSIHTAHPDLNYLFVGAGTTGTLMGCGAYFKKRNLPVKVIGVDVFGSVTFGSEPAKRRIPGLGTSRRPEICDNDLVDDVIWVSETATISRCRWFAHQYGLPLGGSSGSVMAGIQQYAPNIPAGSKVVFISPDRGDKYIDTIYNDDWVQQHFGRHWDEAIIC